MKFKLDDNLKNTKFQAEPEQEMVPVHTKVLSHADRAIRVCVCVCVGGRMHRMRESCKAEHNQVCEHMEHIRNEIKFRGENKGMPGGKRKTNEGKL